ncbi:ABC transporter permease [Actinophytocola sp.]|uniref:ABC transporter permease n=1 Tax=Actinophytocola sp. TaxID=1872138 RepID=UPI002ED48FEC
MRWASDLTLGVRLAVSGRTSIARLVLSVVGIAVATAVLLVAASIGTINNNRMARVAATMYSPEPVAGVSPTYVRTMSTKFRDEYVNLTYVSGSGPDSPKPAGLPTLPKPGEMYASPALIELLRSADGELLRPRFPEKIVGTLDKSLVVEPGYLVAWVGADSTVADWDNTEKVYGFNVSPPLMNMDPAVMALLLIGAVVLLLPVFVFVSTASRIAGAERDRRLSALRLVGAGSSQVRRIAAAESLVSAVIGLTVGAAVFAFARPFADDINVMGEQVYASDVVPDPLMAVLVVLLIPTLTVMTALFALRRTIIEPLGVVRHTKPVRRRAWWRFALIAVGVVLLTTQLGADDKSDSWAWTLFGGATLLLIGVPVLLPWVVERVAGRASGGPPSWVLAIRRLQLDSGTSARVVGGVAVVLAGAIALQTMLMSVEDGLDLPDEDTNAHPGVVSVIADPALAGEIQDNLGGAAGVRSVYPVRTVTASRGGEEEPLFSVAILDCAAIKALANIRSCVDGDVFRSWDSGAQGPQPGKPLEFREYDEAGGSDRPRYDVVADWTIPENLKDVTLSEQSILYDPLLVTPGALKDVALDGGSTTVVATVTRDLTDDQLEGIRNSVADFRYQSYVYSYNTGPELTVDQQTYVSVRTGLYAGSIFTLMLAAVSLLVLALEHIRERRRPLAVLAASGVPRSVLARSLLWQVALPIVLGVAMALATGVGLAAVIIQQVGETLSVDWPGIAILCAGALTLSLLVSATTLPFLRSATRLTTIRME